MTALPLLLLSLSICLSANAATIPTSSNPSDAIVTCRSGGGCSTQNIDGRSYRIMKLPGLVLMVSIAARDGYTRADISIMNKSHKHIRVLPRDFRLEVLTSSPRTVVSLSPENAVHTAADGFSQLRRTSHLSPPTQISFADNTLEPNEGTQGRLLFATGKNNHLIKVVLTLGGVWYEFPYGTP